MSLRARLPLAAATAALLAVFAAAPVSAKKKDEEEKRNQYTVNETMHKKLTSVLELMEAEQYDEARQVLAPLEAKADRLKPYERALVYQMQGYVDASEENYDSALAYFEKCLAEAALPPGAQISTRFNVAQLYFATERYSDAVRTLELWFEEAPSPTSVAYYLLAVGRYQLEDVEGAVGPAEKAVEMAEVPKEPWLQLLAGLYFDVRRYSDALRPMEMLVTLYPKKNYWTQLSALYAQQDQEQKALAAMQLAYEQGFLDRDRELRQLAQLYLAQGLPYRAALVLEDGLDDERVESEPDAWELLGTCWILAREYERAIGPLARGAELSDKGDLYVRLGQVHLERGNWSEAVDALSNALRKGDLRKPGDANLLLGIAFYQQKRLDRARRHFGAASTRDSSREAARHWLDLLDREEQSG